MEDLIEANAELSVELPPNAILLTFDDGYIDHFANVFPALDEARIQGSFFPPGKAICEQLVLDVNKIHFVLAEVHDKSKIVDRIYNEISANKEKLKLHSPESYYKKLAVPNRYDTAEVIFIKRILQRELPATFRHEIVNKLFQEFVTQDENGFSAELYMSLEQLSCMRRNGMYIGNHGYNHSWLNMLSREDQEMDIERSLGFLDTMGCSLKDWVMCYPYGGYNDSLIEVIKKAGCCLGLNTDVNIADLKNTNPYTLPRINTNDIPIVANANPNFWTVKAMHQGDSK
jgi:peptidoglycan/xylan/chitin deacetylase (PgdA/CDA1 family)